jgi:hypothetical protein
MAAAPRRRAARGHEPWVLTRSFTARSAGAPVVSPIHYNQMRITVICVVRNEITATYAVSFIMLHGLPPAVAAGLLLPMEARLGRAW